jgi:hypothetical protein
MPKVRIGNQDVFISDSIPEESRDDIYREILDEQRLQREGAATPNTAISPPTSAGDIAPLPKQPSPHTNEGYTTYIIKDKRYQLPNNFTEEEKEAFFWSKLGAPDTSSSSTNPEAITTESLQHDPDWLHASKVTYGKREGKPFTGTDAEAAEYGVNQMGWFNYNLPTMAVDANRMRTADTEEKQAFLHLMDTYDKLGISWGGVGRALKGIAADPSTYVGLSTLGIGMAGSTAGKVLTKEDQGASQDRCAGRCRGGAMDGSSGQRSAIGEDQCRGSNRVRHR